MNLSHTEFIERFNQDFLKLQEKHLESLGMFDLQTQPMANAKLHCHNIFPNVKKNCIEHLNFDELTASELSTSSRFALTDIIQSAFSTLDSIASPEQIPFISKAYLDAMVEKMDEDCIVLFCGNSASKIFGHKANYLSMDFKIDEKMYHRPMVKNHLSAPNSSNHNRIYVIKKDLFKLFVHPVHLHLEKRVVNETAEIISDLQFTFELSLKGLDYVGDRFVAKNPKERLFISCEFPKHLEQSF